MARMTRRRFLQYGAAGGAAMFVPWALRPQAAGAAMGGKLAKYVQRVPLPTEGIRVATPSATNAFGGPEYWFTQKEISRQLHPSLPETPLWAYDGPGIGDQEGSFGMAVAAQTGTPVTMRFTNELPKSYPSWIPVDVDKAKFGSEVRVMTHLHGGFVAGESDGNPVATPDLYAQGETQYVLYPNESGKQPASLLWFHDHGLGTTRLNVFAGLAAGYILRDEFDTGEEPNPAGIPG
jgi:spore coat protein A, manganese oxidase